MKHKNRLATLRGTQTQKEFAARLGLKQSNYWKYENGKQRLNSALIEKICLECGCTAEWLLCIDGDNAKTMSEKGYVATPLYGSIAAGTPIEMLEVDDEFPIPAEMASRYPDAFLLKVAGESMNLKIPNGAYALVSPTSEVIDGQPYAVCVNGDEATIKRVRKLHNGFELIPESTDPTFEVKTYNYNEPGTETITVIGRVVYYVLPYDWSF